MGRYTCKRYIKLAKEKQLYAVAIVTPLEISPYVVTVPSYVGMQSITFEKYLQDEV